MGVHGETSSLKQFRFADSQSIRSGRSVQSENQTKRLRGHTKRKDKALKVITIRRHVEIGFGFSIRGGIEHGTGIFVSNINQYSDAHSQGLQIGDQVIRANKYNFERMTHDVAVQEKGTSQDVDVKNQFIQRHKTLRLVVLSLGIVPGSKIEKTHYQWIDCYGRPCSPLLLQNDKNERMRLPENDDERKVNIVVGNNARLGLLIRGGCEYGLGIYVAGIDEDSVADRSGIMVGEQILDVNGINFQNISHTDAAHIIRTSKMMTMILKDVGKIPLARVVMDTTEWIDGKSVRSRSAEENNSTSVYNKESKIHVGIAGSQLNHESITGPKSYQWIEGKAQEHLTSEEYIMLRQYIRQYTREEISVKELVMSLVELLDTKEKSTLIPEVRGIVRPSDIDVYDEMMFRIEMLQIKAENEQEKRLQQPSFESFEEEEEEEDLHGEEKGTSQDVDVKDQYHRNGNIYEEDHRNGNIYEEEESEEYYDHQDGEISLEHHDEEPKHNNFNYAALQEESYNSFSENPTDETLLQDSPQKQPYQQHKSHVQNIMDEGIPETIEEEDALYAQVKKGKFRKKPPPHRSILKEHQRKDSDLSMNSLQKSSAYERDDTEYEQTNLGYAFNFLDEEKEKDDNRQENGSTSPKEYASRKKSSSRKSSSSSDIASVTSLDNTVSPIEVSKQDRYFRDPRGLIVKSQIRQIDEVVDVTESHDIYAAKGTTETNMVQRFSTDSYNYNTKPDFSQPKVSFTEAPPRDNQDENDGYLNSSLINYEWEDKNESQNPTNYEKQRQIFSNDNRQRPHSPVYRTKSPDFSSQPSYDHRVSNFAVNDIMRQNFLPTTRVDYSPIKRTQSPVSEGFPEPPSFHDNENHSDVYSAQNLNRINRLNIQNQYEYERNRTVSFDSTPSNLEEPKTYGKPVMTKSPRPDYQPSSFKLGNLPMKVKTIDLADDKEDKRHFINIPKLKKTANSDKLFSENITENETTIRDHYFGDESIRKSVEDLKSIAPGYQEPMETIIYDSEVKHEEVEHVKQHGDLSEGNTIRKRITFEKHTVDVKEEKQHQPHFDFDMRSSQADNEFNTKYVRKTQQLTDTFPISTRHRINDDSTSGDVETTLKRRHVFNPKLSSETYYERPIMTDNNDTPRKTYDKDIQESVNQALQGAKTQSSIPTKSQSHATTRYTPADVVHSYPTTNNQFQKGIKYERTSRHLFDASADFRVNQSHEEAENQHARSVSPGGLVRSRLDVFNKDQVGGAVKNKSKPNEITWLIEPTERRRDPVIIIPRTSDEPGFQIDSRGYDKNREIFISNIDDPQLYKYGLNVGDVIVGINKVMFKKGIQKGLANLMLQNAFNNKTASHVTLELKS